MSQHTPEHMQAAGSAGAQIGRLADSALAELNRGSESPATLLRLILRRIEELSGVVMSAAAGDDLSTFRHTLDA